MKNTSASTSGRRGRPYSRRWTCYSWGGAALLIRLNPLGDMYSRALMLPALNTAEALIVSICRNHRSEGELLHSVYRHKKTQADVWMRHRNTATTCTGRVIREPFFSKIQWEDCVPTKLSLTPWTTYYRFDRDVIPRSNMIESSSPRG